ncbi:uncharacterized protein I206_107661 [Kwoniella pini CBS 10737]|uniref:AGC/DMPK protein kinase n=1 Tax=Kwoniella pini CBS 10737 TaxID=1296096 RepID=A0A1B9HY16_9TREE|nr:AGC/DMPK protein kinase [Kwoniella pini CBS 10737]OCF48128.1 AGC/DMPK protein kinase [Kwoniella pini CBS 10737]
MTSSPSYAHRHLLLTNLLKQHPLESDVHSSYDFPVTRRLLQQKRSIALDVILLKKWNGRVDHADQDLFHHVDNLRLSRRDFEIIGRLGDGQFGVVDAVECRLNGQIYAIKTMRKHAITRAGPQISLAIERHIHILAHSEDGPVPRLIAAFQGDQTVSLVTTYAACGSLWDRLCFLSEDEEHAGRMSETEIKAWAPQMIAAIQWVHDQGFVHRDIKPNNFLVTDIGRLLLTDFGSAAALLSNESTDQRRFLPYNQCLLPVGTPDYIAPEILMYAEDALVHASEATDDETADQRHGYDLSVDWWSFGATLHEMTLGKGPFWAPSIQQTYNLLIKFQGNIHLPSTVSSELREVMLKYVA